MPKQCPDCKKFMKREIGFPLGTPSPWSAWVCSNEYCELNIAAPEYDWEYYGLTNQELTELQNKAPIFAAQIAAERDEYYAMRKSRYRKVF